MGHLLEGKLTALESQYQQGMGTTDTTGLSVVTPAARAVLSKIEQKAGTPMSAPVAAAAPVDGQEGIVEGVTAVWKSNGSHGPGWYKK